MDSKVVQDRIKYEPDTYLVKIDLLSFHRKKNLQSSIATLQGK